MGRGENVGEAILGSMIGCFLIIVMLTAIVESSIKGILAIENSVSRAVLLGLFTGTATALIGSFIIGILMWVVEKTIGFFERRLFKTSYVEIWTGRALVVICLLIAAINFASIAEYQDVTFSLFEKIIISITGIAGALGVFFLFGSFGGNDFFKSSHGTACFSSYNMAKRISNRLSKDQVPNHVCLGRFTDKKRLWYSGHIMTCAPTGSGKGVGAVIPNLLTYEGSVLVLDIKGENYAVTHQQRKDLGQAVYLVDPFRVTGDTGQSFNWMDFVNLDFEDCISEAATLAEMIVVKASKSDPYWDDSAQELIQGLILYVASLDESKRNILEVRKILTLPEERLIEILTGVSGSNLAYEVPSRIFNAFIAKTEKERSSVLSTAQRHTAFLDDPQVARALSRSDFMLSDLKEHRISIYIALPPAKIQTQSRFMRGFVGLALAAMMKDNRQPPEKVMFFLDEFAQLGHMGSVENAISLSRGYGVFFWIFVQDLSQLKAVYPKWQTFMANGVKQFFGTSEFDTAKYISESLGNRTMRVKTISESTSTSGFLNPESSTKGISTHDIARSLMTPDEVMALPNRRQISLIPGERPYKSDRVNYLTDKEYKGLYAQNPFHMRKVA